MDTNTGFTGLVSQDYAICEGVAPYPRRVRATMDKLDPTEESHVSALDVDFSTGAPVTEFNAMCLGHSNVASSEVYLDEQFTTGKLLKNYFFTESTCEEYEELWAPIFEKDREMANYWDAEVVSGRLKRPNIDFFFAAYLNIKIQDPAIKVSADHKMRYRRSEGLFNNYKDLISTYNLDKKTMIYDIL